MTLAAGSVAALALAIFLLLPLRRQFPGTGRTGARYALVACCVALNAGLAAQLPLVHEPLDRAAGFALAWPVQHALFLVAACGCRVFILLSVETDRARAHRRVVAQAVLVAVLIAGMAVAFSAAPGDPAFEFGPLGRTDQVVAGAPATSIAYLCFSAYLFHAAVIATRVFVRLGRRAAHLPHLRAGMHTSAVGAGLTGVYALHDVVTQTLFLIRITPGWNAGLADNILMPLSGTFVMAGLSASAIRAAWTAARTGLRRRRTTLALYPLWTQFYAAMPAIAYTPPRSYWAAMFGFGSTDRRLYRLLVELWDGRAYLLRRLPADSRAVAEQAALDAGLGPDRAGRVAEAALIVAGLDAVRRGAPAPAEPVADRPADFDSLDDNGAWWRGIQSAADEPLAAEIADRIRALFGHDIQAA
ncbi:MAB_1171c family putative transporter [Amycolatopsis sp. WGS_07]|uniref:MAB_1171c family putative transporter n=1 Tax=Amycolatopsis sp. WGS_07 TaxID=3076764 RepID=UPI0038733719